MTQQVVSQRNPLQRTAEEDPVEENWDEFGVILESAKGRNSADAFGRYLDEHLSQLDHEFSSSSSNSAIRKFTLKLDNRLAANFRMQVLGFEKMEIRWKSNSDGEISDMWYRIDDKEVKSLDFSSDQRFSIRVKHRHQEF